MKKFCPDEATKTPEKYNNAISMEMPFKWYIYMTNYSIILLIYKELLQIKKRNTNITTKTKEINKFYTKDEEMK
jgi:hypothetical protein